MPYVSTRDLKEDVLYRASEPLGGASDWETKAVEYLNRVYRALCTGASEFLPEYVDDWWWMREDGILLFDPAYVTGTVSVVQGSASISFSNPPAQSMAGRRLRVDHEPDVPIIASHTGGAGGATLDAVWTGNTIPTGIFKAMKVEYDLAAAVQALMSPIVIFGHPNQIVGVSPERLDNIYPLSGLDTGIPKAFSLENTQRVRFSHGGSQAGYQYRLEYRYRPTVADLTDSVMSIPLVPLEYRHVLADMALTYVLIDKNDDRSNAVALGARTGLGGMLKDNRRRNVKIDVTAGHIATRPLNSRLERGR